MSIPQSLMRFLPVLRRRPDAQADIAGGRENPCLRGSVCFYQTPQGVLVLAEMSGLPDRGCRCEDNIFAFHIHSGGSCAGSSDDPFSAALGHYNPERCPHPAHAGDMPPLFSNNGYALQAFLTDGRSSGGRSSSTIMWTTSPPSPPETPARGSPAG